MIYAAIKLGRSVARSGNMHVRMTTKRSTRTNGIDNRPKRMMPCPLILLKQRDMRRKEEWPDQLRA